MKFSLVIPVYNVAPYLPQCLDSVLGQTCADWEAICVDDGSTDGSGAILDGYAAKYRRFRVIHQKNCGVGTAKNTALGMAQGDWLWFVDADDAIHPEALSYIQAALEENPEAQAFCFGQGAIRETSYPECWPELPPCKNAELISTHNSRIILGFRMGGWTAVVRRNLIGKLRFGDYSVGEDVLFMISYYWNTDSWCLLPAPLYFYRIRPGSAMSSAPTLRFMTDFLRTQLSLLKLWDEYRSKWRFADNLDFLKGDREMNWYTYQERVLELSDEDLRQVIPLWVDLQRGQYAILPEVSWQRRVIVSILSVFRSAVLFRFFIGRNCKWQHINDRLTQCRLVSPLRRFWQMSFRRNCR